MPNQFSLRLWSNSDSAPPCEETCQSSTRRSKSWRVRLEMARVWLPVQLRGRANAKREGEGRTFDEVRSLTDPSLDPESHVASKDWTLASRDGSWASASAPGL